MHQTLSQHTPSDTKKRRRYTRAIAACVAGCAIILLGIWTYAQRDVRQRQRSDFVEVNDDLKHPKEQPRASGRHLSLRVPPVPSDEKITSLLNGELPQTCPNCDAQPLTCLRTFTVDKRVMQGRGASYLALDITTPSHTASKVYTVVFDLAHPYVLVRKGGEIASEACRTLPQREAPMQLFHPGTDPQNHRVIHFST